MNRTHIPAVNRILAREYRKRYAPVTRLAKARGNAPFRILVSTILSARTKDDTTAAACTRLFKFVKKPGDLARLSQKRLEALIFPVGFYHTKARHLRQLPKVLDSLFNGRIPRTIDQLCKLPGVGRKTANLVMTTAFDKPGICVDVHVHRICNRLGLIKTRTPFESEMALRRILPLRYWKTWNEQLVSFGQTVCTPLRPRCPRCPLGKYCPSGHRKQVIGNR
jgi:endonuclease III